MSEKQNEQAANPSELSALLGEHTPGPWKVGKTTYTAGNQVPMVSVESHCDTDFPHHIARVGFGIGDSTEANARLIAAAPLMLEALSMAFDRDLTYLSGHAEIPAQDVVRARLAIAVALGKTPNAEAQPTARSAGRLQRTVRR